MSTRTCSYLLGNKGCHSYNGNPKELLILDEKTKILIEKRVHESVGHITMPDLTGTGFRVGTKYLMSAYHVFKYQIEKSMNYILSVFCKLNQENERAIQDLEKALCVKRKTKEKDFTTTVKSLLWDHLVNHGTDMKLLLECLETLIFIDPITTYLSKMWEQCIVEFSEEMRFYIDWDIKFGDEDHDVIIVELKNDNPQEVPFPPPLLIDYKHRPKDNIQIVRYTIEDKRDPDDHTKMLSQKEIIVSTKCELFSDNFDKVKQACIDWWKNWEGIKEYIGDKTIDFQNEFEKDCPSQYDKTTGVVITQASHSFRKGSSGSPMMYFNSTVRQPVVTSIFQGGLPTFFYDKIEKGNENWGSVKDCNDCEEHLFEKGMSVEKICALLHTHRKEKLKDNILTPLQQVEENISSYSGRRDPTDIMKKTVEAWERDDKTCFVTKGVKETQERILSNNCVCVTGDPGSGKSMSIRHAALHLKKMHDFTIYPISSPDDFFKYLHERKSQVFVIDDILGIHSVYKNLMDKWSKYHDVIKSLLSNETKILASLRTHLVQHQNVRLEDFIFLEKSKRVDFYDERYRLDNEEMKDMLRWRLNVCKVKDVEEIIEKVWGLSSFERKVPRKSDSFPLLCNMFCKDDKYRNDPGTFFNDPFPALNRTFRNMKQENRPLFCGLVLCVTFDGKLSGDNLSTFAEFLGELKDKTVTLRDSLVRSLRLDPRSDLDKVKSALDANDGVYIRRIGNDYEISHRIFQDIVTFVYNDKHFLFKCGTSQFIKDRVRLKTLPDDDQFVVLCDGDTYIDRLATRLTDDFKKSLAENSKSDLEMESLRAASFIVENPNIDNDQLIDCLHSKSLDKEAVDILFKQCFITIGKRYESLKRSRDGEKEILQLKLVRLLLKLGADCNMCIGDSWPLHISVNACSMQLTSLLLEKGADMRFCDLEYGSVLHRACSQYNNLSFVKLFLVKGIDKLPAVRLLAKAKQQKLTWLADDILRPERVQLEEVVLNGSQKVLTNDLCRVDRLVKKYSGKNTLQLVEILHNSCLNSGIVRTGQSALHLAVRNGKASDVGELLSLGSKLSCKNNADNQGRTPEDYLDDDAYMDDREKKINLFKQFDAYP